MQLTKEQIRALNTIWNQIADDVLECCADENEDAIMSRDSVIELVLDADRPTTLFPNIDWSDFYSVSHNERMNMCRQQVFTDEIYGR